MKNSPKTARFYPPPVLPYTEPPVLGRKGMFLGVKVAFCRFARLGKLIKIFKMEFSTALNLFLTVHEVAEKYQYNAAMYGSVLRKGSGKDLDIFLIPKWETPSYQLRGKVENMYNEIYERLHATERAQPYFGLMNTFTVRMLTPLGIVDMVVREFNITPSDYSRAWQIHTERDSG